jgi:DNA polymerase-3 subunit epsilon
VLAAPSSGRSPGISPVCWPPDGGRHNVEFDLGFLRAEFAWAGAAVPLITERSMCTMALAGYLHPGARRTLAACCSAAGIPLAGWHSALADTRATARLFSHYLTRFPSPPPWQWAYEEVSRLAWPDLPAAVFTPDRAPRPRGWPARLDEPLVDQLPARTAARRRRTLLAVLDTVLTDREINGAVRRPSGPRATGLGLSRSHVAELHRVYLEALADALWADGEVTTDQRSDLDRWAMLAHGPATVDQALLRASAGRYVVPPRPGVSGFPVGSTVVSPATWSSRASHGGTARAAPASSLRRWCGRTPPSSSPRCGQLSVKGVCRPGVRRTDRPRSMTA